MCIRNELGEELLASVLGLPILGESDTEQWQVSIYECLDPETAATSQARRDKDWIWMRRMKPAYGSF